MSVQRYDIPVRGMDCQECAEHVRSEVARVPGVTLVDVLLTSEKAIVEADPTVFTMENAHAAIRRSGYEPGPEDAVEDGREPGAGLSRQLLIGLVLVFGVILFVVVIGEALGFLDQITETVPWPIWLGLIFAGGFPIFRNVVRALLNRQILAHTLMTVGMIAAIVVGQWATALIIVFFMRIATWVEGFTATRARQAVRDLTEMAPQVGRVIRNGEETLMPVSEIQPGDTVLVRPGDQIPVDGDILSGQATINQASITGESMPVERATGDQVFAATFAQLGSLQIRATQVGEDTTFGKVIQMVEEAERHRGDTQRLADRFSGYYLPVVLTIAGLTFLVSRDPLATAAVLVVACSCSFALATPIAVIASVGSAAKRGLIIKGGRYLEALAKADVILVDKTGTLTLGQPRITDVIPLNGMTAGELLRLAATAERNSEHPLAEAVRRYASEQDFTVGEPETFEAIPGFGVRATIGGHVVAAGNPRLAGDIEIPAQVDELQTAGKTVLLITIDGRSEGVLGAEDTIRREVPAAIDELRQYGIEQITLLTGDHDAVARSLAGRLNIDYRANLLPDDKIGVVRELQARGHTVVMIGDGVNDAPAIAQADVGIAMGVAGTPVAIEAAHIALMRDDWMLVPDVFRTARRTMGIVRGNLGFTAVYNLLGLSLAAFGFLPPAIAAAAQAIPDIGILGNSSRLLRGRRQNPSEASDPAPEANPQISNP